MMGLWDEYQQTTRQLAMFGDPAGIRRLVARLEGLEERLQLPRSMLEAAARRAIRGDGATLADACAAVVAVFGDVTEAELRGRCRDRRISRPRAVFCWLATRWCGRTTGEVARWLGRDPSTPAQLARHLERAASRDDELTRLMTAARAAVAAAFGGDDEGSNP